ncbi:MAG: GNAT family N-acetyltransferase [Gammaproteobacteria bacterium]|nr:GNAT family N-acetyltransferase [Gammaproteobacteria bacterium]
MKIKSGDRSSRSESNDQDNDQSSVELFICPEDKNSLSQWDHPSSRLNQLSLSADPIDPFCVSTHWNFSFQEAFSPNRKLLIRSNSDSAIAFAENVFENGEVILTPIEAYWLFANPLLGSNAVELLAESIEEIEDHYQGEIPRILISGLKYEKDPFKSKLQQMFGGKFGFSFFRQEELCSASLEGGFDGFLSRRSTSYRRSLRKQVNRSQKHGFTFERHIPITEAEALAVYERMIAVELASWKGIGQCGMAEHPAKEFYLAMITRLAQDQKARIILARHEGKDIGFIFGGLAENHYRGQQFSFDQEWASSSVGNLMQLEQIQWLCEEGVTHYDLGPIMDYKHHWTEQRAISESWFLVQL